MHIIGGEGRRRGGRQRAERRGVLRVLICDSLPSCRYHTIQSRSGLVTALMTSQAVKRVRTAYGDDESDSTVSAIRTIPTV